MCSYMYTMVDDNNTIEDKVCKSCMNGKKY